LSRYDAPRTGKPIRPQPRGFPSFYGRRRLRRIITGDIWAYLRYVSSRRLTAAESTKASAYIDQAYDFYAAAANPRQSSRPLLYYYAFLNLAKVLLLHRGVNLPPKLQHGISDPRANIRQRLRLEGQVVRVEGCAANNCQLFPEMVRRLAGSHSPKLPATFRVLDLLAEIPAIHRTYCMTMGAESRFCPVKSVEVLRDNEAVWARVSFAKHDRDIKSAVKLLAADSDFREVFHPVCSKNAGELWFETKPRRYHSNRGIDAAIGVTASRVRRSGVWAIVTPNGYSWYFFGAPTKSRLPSYCSAYAVMFYLGSITRYKPYDFHKIVKGYAWLINEFLDTQPAQVLHILASTIAGSEVVIPHANRVSMW
jgi:hypothetical protein